MANLYTKEVIVGMIYVVHVVKRNKKKNLFSCDSLVSLKSILLIFDARYFVADYFIRRKQARIFLIMLFNRIAKIIIIIKTNWLLQNENQSQQPVSSSTKLI